MEKTPAWEAQLWAELDALPVEQQIVEAGELIIYITHNLLTALSHYRGDAAERAVSQPGMNPALVADHIGSRRTVIERLVSASRQRKREAEAVGG